MKFVLSINLVIRNNLEQFSEISNASYYFFLIEIETHKREV